MRASHDDQGPELAPRASSLSPALRFTYLSSVTLLEITRFAALKRAQ